MRTSTLIVRFAVAAVTLGLIAPLSTLAQTFAASTGTNPVISTTPSPSVMKVPLPKNAEENLLYGRVRDGVYTVDGMVAKLKLNYDVNGAHFLYMFVPGVGTAVLSSVADPDAITSEARLQENELKFSVGDHRFMLTGVALANSKGKVPDHLFVKLDRSAWRLNRHPMLGFGNAAQLPYQWPGALASNSAPLLPEEKEIIPPVPASLLPSTAPVTPAAGSATAVKPASLRPVAMQ